MTHRLQPFAHSRLLVALLTAALVAGCGGNPPPAVTTSVSQQSTTLRAGDITIRASAVVTSDLAVDTLGEYGIARSDDTVLLLVALRRGADAQETSVPAQVRATVTDLSGQRHEVPMRELRSGELLDYVGTLEVSTPDTLRFDLHVVPEGGRVSTMQFTREFHPR